MPDIEFNEKAREEQCPECGELYLEGFQVCMDCENRAELELARYQV